jgi:hypothetical protein
MIVSLGVTRSLHPNTPCSDPRAWALENAARTALDLRANRAFTDAEWARSCGKLLEFGTIVRGWDQKAGKTAPELGNVERLCLRER